MAAQQAAAIAASASRQVTAAAARTTALTASVPAAPAAAPSPRYLAAHPVRSLPLVYPIGASANGTVTVEFTLSPNGAASDVVVVQSDLPGVFAREAIRAVQHGRFSTHELVKGQSARARIKLRFSAT